MATTRSQARSTSNWYVSGLTEEINEMKLSEHIERTDKTLKVSNIRILRNMTTGRTLGTGIIDFATQEDGMIFTLFTIFDCR